MTLTRRAVAAGLAASLVPLGRAAAQPVPPEEDGFRVLAAAPLKMKLHPDAPAEAELWAFNGAVPGPTLRVRHGEEVRVRLKNRTPAPLSLHWHGVRIANAMDGVGGLTQEPVAPGQDFDYRFTPARRRHLPLPAAASRARAPSRRSAASPASSSSRSAPRRPVDREHVVVVDDWRLNRRRDARRRSAARSRRRRAAGSATCSPSPASRRRTRSRRRRERACGFASRTSATPARSASASTT